MHDSPYQIMEKTIIFYLKDRLCETKDEFMKSNLFSEMLEKFVLYIKENKPSFDIFAEVEQIEKLKKTLILLSDMKADYIPKVYKDSKPYLEDPKKFESFISLFYNYFRQFNRFIICHSQDERLDKRPYRTFASTIESLNHLTRQVYRETLENLTDEHPRVYRQVIAGAECAAITIPWGKNLPSIYSEKNNGIPLVRQLLINPPLILYPSMNKREGMFEETFKNPINQTIQKQDYLGFPLKVGKYFILVYVHKSFYELGFALANLFEIADDSSIKSKPDAIYYYGLGEDEQSPCTFYEDTENELLVAKVPAGNKYGYFGYLKKMVLTLHNILVLKEGGLPFHGSCMKITLKNGIEKTLIIIGDSGAGKSETIEAMQTISKDIDTITIVADDMGSIWKDNDSVFAIGSEIGAFMRIDDLGPGYAFGQLDRSVIMSPASTNARIVIPVTPFDRVIENTTIDAILYANNYESPTETEPLLEWLKTPEEAIKIFKEGKVMSKGTTTTKGIVQNYFANIFGAPQKREIHDERADEMFSLFFKNNIKVGQFRTQLGVKGMEQEGPSKAAHAVLNDLFKN